MIKLKRDFLPLLLCFNAATLLVPRNFKFVPIVLLLGYAAFHFFKTKTFNKNLFLVGALPYFILVFGMIYTENLSYGFKKLGTGISMLIYPLCFAFLSKEKITKHIKINLTRILLTFCISVLLFSYAIFLYFIITEGRTLSYIIQHYGTLIDRSITSYYEIHPIYLALHVGLSIIITAYLIINKKIKHPFWLGGSIIISALFILAVLNKRMAIIGLIMVAVYSIFHYFKFLKNKKRIILIAILSIAFLVTSIILLPRYNNQNSFKEFINVEASIKDKNTSLGKRVFIYQSAIDLIKQKFVFGYGTGDANKNLHLQMEKNLNTTVIKYNSHNQYLSYFIFTGFLGFLAFVYYNFRLFKNAITSKDIMFLSLLLFFTINMLSENILEREAGVLCFAFIINLFFAKNHVITND